MRVSSISVNTHLQNTAKNKSVQKTQNTAQNYSSNPSFSGVYLGALQETDIKKLFFDSKELLNITQRAMPMLQEKFSKFFDAALNIYPDVNRTININIRKNFSETESLKRYIIKNNDKFKFPQKMIDDFKLGQYSQFDGWLNEPCYTPFGVFYDKLGEKETMKRIYDFIRDIHDDKIISDIYKMRNHEYVVNKKIPSYYWETIGG